MAHLLRRYWLVAATILVGMVGAGLVVAGQPVATRWLLGSFALLVALQQAWAMVADLRRGSWGIDVLAITAIVAAVAFGEYWAALIVCLMLSGGEALEDYAAGRAQRDLTTLLTRAPRTARRLRADGATDEVGVEDVEVGDELLVRPGDMVPVDGTLLSGVATVDESQLTGEPLPAEYVTGDALMSGSVNGPQAVRMRATASAADSQYQQIIALVKQASEVPAPMVRLADRVAVPFTIVAYLVAGLAWLISGEAVRVAQVLVVATPCPLLIAAPVAFLAGMSRSARNGIIVKGGGILERLSRVRTVAFDKTGTLTYGQPRVVEVLPAAGWRAAQVLEQAAAAEQFSAHPLARAVITAAQDQGLEVPRASEARDHVGRGVSAMVAGQRVRVGKGTWITEHTGADAFRARTAGELGMHVAVGDVYAGTITLADKVRADAAWAVDVLPSFGVQHVVLVTGDSQEAADHVAAELAISEVHADCLPATKVSIVAAQPRRGVMAVGDGVNDAPMLAAADVGVAMGAQGSTAATEAADVVILRDDIHRSVSAVALGRRTTAVAMQAIGLGVGLSLVLMVLAAFGYIPAVVGALLQEVVDVACIGWALLAARPGKLERAMVSPPGASVVDQRPAGQVASSAPDGSTACSARSAVVSSNQHSAS